MPIVSIVLLPPSTRGNSSSAGRARDNAREISVYWNCTCRAGQQDLRCGDATAERAGRRGAQGHRRHRAVVACGAGPLRRVPMAEAEGVVVVRGGAAGFVQE